MKKSVTIFAGISLVMCAVGYFSSTTNDSTEDLTAAQIANIEALSDVELPGNELRNRYCVEDESSICYIFWTYSGSETINETYYFGYKSINS
jgi:hypothetical protein